jgi:L-fuconolactonase
MIGSDWPVCTLAGCYETILSLTADCVVQLSPSEQNDIWHSNAEKFYRLQVWPRRGGGIAGTGLSPIH